MSVRDARGILARLIFGFPEPCGHFGFQPSPKHTWEGGLRPNKSPAAVPVRSGGYSAVAMASDTDVEAGWTPWRMRGFTHEPAVQRKLIVVVRVPGAVTTAALIAYTLLRP